MSYVFWTIVSIFLFIAVIILVIKIVSMKRSISEICSEFNTHVKDKSSALISTSSNDKEIKKLAYMLNIKLKEIDVEYKQYASGNRELKEAVTNISHDIRTPLTAILGYLDLAENEQMTEKQKKYISIIRNRAEMMKSLTDELFEYSVIIATDDTDKIELVSVNCVLEESIAAFYSNLMSRDIEPDINICEDKVIRNVNKSSLTRVFSNLLNNAVKYSDGDLEIKLCKNGEIIFANTASKLNEVQVGKLFDRFYTVEEGRKSTGLGLSIAKTLVERMNGKISADYRNKKLSIYISL